MPDTGEKDCQAPWLGTSFTGSFLPQRKHCTLCCLAYAEEETYLMDLCSLADGWLDQSLVSLPCG